MKRTSIFGATLLLVATLAAGCGQSPTSGVPFSEVRQATSHRTPPSQAYTRANDTVTAATPRPQATPTPGPKPTASPASDTATAPASDNPDATATAPTANASGTVVPTPAASSLPSSLLSLQVTDKRIVRKMLVLKRLQITLHVSNPGKTTLSGLVKVDFYHTSGLFSKTTKVVETQTQAVDRLPAGQSVDVVLTSTKSVENADATLNTIAGISAASTSDN